MRNASVWLQLLGLACTVVEKVELDEAAGVVVVSVRRTKGARRRCGRCGRRCGLYDRGQGGRRWRALDVGELVCWLEAEAPRVRWPTHGVVAAEVPWARHGEGHTRSFDDAVAWLAVQCSKTAVVEWMRIAWRSVGAIITRVQADIDATFDRLAGLSRIGIDEISYKRGHRYLLVTWNQAAGFNGPSASHELSAPRRFGDRIGREVARPRPSRASRGVAADLDRPRSSTADDRRLRARAC